MTVNNGCLTLPSGMSYRLLVLPNRNTMTPAVARKIRELVNAGATVIGPKPTSSPSLQDYPACDQELQRITAEIWDTNKVIFGKSSRRGAYIAECEAGLSSHAEKIMWIHRCISDADVYFVSNQESNERIVDCAFRVEGRQPELWDAATGEIRDARTFSSEGGLTKLPIKFEPRGSCLLCSENRDTVRRMEITGTNSSRYRKSMEHGRGN